MRVKLHNDSNSETVMFVPGLGSLTPGEWVEVSDETLAEFETVNGYPFEATAKLEVEGVKWPPPVVVEEEANEEDEEE